MRYIGPVAKPSDDRPDRSTLRTASLAIWRLTQIPEFCAYAASRRGCTSYRISRPADHWPFYWPLWTATLGQRREPGRTESLRFRRSHGRVWPMLRHVETTGL